MASTSRTGVVRPSWGGSALHLGRGANTVTVEPTPADGLKQVDKEPKLRGTEPRRAGAGFMPGEGNGGKLSLRTE